MVSASGVLCFDLEHRRDMVGPSLASKDFQDEQLASWLCLFLVSWSWTSLPVAVHHPEIPHPGCTLEFITIIYVILQLMLTLYPETVTFIDQHNSIIPHLTRLFVCKSISPLKCVFVSRAWRCLGIPRFPFFFVVGVLGAATSAAVACKPSATIVRPI